MLEVGNDEPPRGTGVAMKVQVALIVGFVLGISGCSEREQAPADSAADAAMESSAPAEPAVWKNESFIAHMHEHAEVLDTLNFALADGDLAAAKESANWLSTHDTDADIQDEWMPHLYRMRTEAEAVEAAPDLDTARDAAMRITAQCQECHASVGVSTR